MANWLWILFLFIILQRLTELMIAKRNEQWMKNRGGVEVGVKHYKWFIFIHISFFIAIIIEPIVLGVSVEQPNIYLLLIFLMTQVGRVWCILSLGKFWNTKIITLPGSVLIKKGPYKYMKHPNYLIVAIELFTIPLLFGAYVTAAVYPFLHVLLLIIRVPLENTALGKVTEVKKIEI